MSYFDSENEDLSDYFEEEQFMESDKEDSDFYEMFNEPDITREEEQKESISFFDLQRAGNATCLDREHETIISGGSKIAKIQEKIKKIFVKEMKFL